MKICCAASLICFLLVAAMVSSSVVPAKRAERRGVTDHAQKVDDVLPGNILPKLRKHRATSDVNEGLLYVACSRRSDLEILLTKVADEFLIKLLRAFSKENFSEDDDI